MAKPDQQDFGGGGVIELRRRALGPDLSPASGLLHKQKTAALAAVFFAKK